MEQFSVSGMSCAACSTRVEKAVSSVEGVTSCSVSLLTHSMGVEGTASAQSIIAAVEKAGYGATVKGAEKTVENDPLADRETPALKRRLFSSLAFLAALMYLSMGHVMWDWPLPAFFENNPIAIALAQMLLTVIVMAINQKFFISGFAALMRRSPNMDTLVALGAGAAFGYSTFALFAMTAGHAEHWLHELYFEPSAMILTLITVGKMLEARSKGKTTDALKRLMNLAPKTATVLRNGQEAVVPVSQVKRGDVFVVRPGENIPVDGIVLDGTSAVNEAALTGESIPTDKTVGDAVSAATLNQSGFLTCEASRVGEDTTLSQIIKMVSEAAATKAPIAKIADKVSGIFVPVVITIALITVAVWLLVGQSFGYALARGISVLVISCPCALGLATPVAIMVGGGVGARNGILFKTAASLEQAGRIDTVVLDKTGTITAGVPAVTDIISADEAYLLQAAYDLEHRSEHPLAKAVCSFAEARGLHAQNICDFQALAGNGLCAKRNGKQIFGGSARYIFQHVQADAELALQANRLSSQGKTPLFFAEEDHLLGIIAVADVIKEDSPSAIKALQSMGIRVIMLTGDNERTAKAIGAQAGVDEVIAGVLPDEKERVVRKLKESGCVAMVGDGTNDAPALTSADVGIAIGAGTDVAIDAAEIVLMKSRLTDVCAAIRLGRATLRNIRQNLFWAFFYNSLGIPLAAGPFIALLGWALNPMFGAAAMSLSSFCVVTNALRLNFFKLYDSKNDKKRHKKEKKTMKKTITIKGMMCPHCESTVKKALEALAQVDSAEVSHASGTAVVTLNAEISDQLLRETVEAKDFAVIGIE